MAFHKKLEEDKEDEAEAITNYGKRITQTKAPAMKSMLSHIREEEKEHKSKLSGAIRGLRAVRPSKD